MHRQIAHHKIETDQLYHQTLDSGLCRLQPKSISGTHINGVRKLQFRRRPGPLTISSWAFGCWSLKDKRWKVHKAWAKHRMCRQEPVCILENVPAYCDEELPSLLENMYNVHAARFCPSQLGFSAARPRYYGLLLHKEMGTMQTSPRPIQFSPFWLAWGHVNRCNLGSNRIRI